MAGHPVYRLPARAGRAASATATHDPIEYKLPITLVHVHGTVTTTTSDLDAGAKRVEQQATIEIDVVADPHSHLELRPPADAGWQDRQVGLALMTDGRLTSAGAEVVDRSGERIKAVVSLGATAAGGLLALGATPLLAGAAAVGAAALGTLALHGAIEELGADGTSGTAVDPQQQTPAPDPVLCPADFGIRSEFGTEHPADQLLLTAYRFALVRLTAELAMTAADPNKSPITKAELVRGLSVVLARTRAEAELVEARYDAWLHSKEHTRVVVVDRRLPATGVPDSKTFRTAIRNGRAAPKPLWWHTATTLRTMVTIDYLDGPLEAPTKLVPPAGSIVYRPPRAARLTTWKIVDSTSTATQLDAEVIRRDRILVTVPGTERTIGVLTGKKAGKVKLGFDLSGALTSLDVSTSGAAAGKAEALSAVPGAIEQALASGQAIGGAFDPRQLELQRLERDVKIAESNAKLKGPADPDPALKKLQDRLSVAQLEARIAASEYVSANPSQATIIVSP